MSLKIANIAFWQEGGGALRQGHVGPSGTRNCDKTTHIGRMHMIFCLRYVRISWRTYWWGFPDFPMLLEVPDQVIIIKNTILRSEMAKIPENPHFHPFFYNRDVQMSNVRLKTFEIITFWYNLTISSLERSSGVSNREIMTKNHKFGHFWPKIHQKSST